jgi:hypothetical protein
MHWSTALYQAAERFDGGARSFPLHSEATFARQYAYEPPNEDYQRLFSRRAQISWSQVDEDASPHSAGWLIPDSGSASICKPVFIAHSTLAAIWLLRETLNDDALPAESWCRLVRAAQSLADEPCEDLTPTRRLRDTAVEPILTGVDDNTVDEPPSAQVSCSLPRVTRKRAASSAQASSPKRTCIAINETPPPSPPISGDNDTGREIRNRVTTITNNNRRAEQQRIKKMDSLRAKKRIELGLQAPDNKAPLQEHAAYNAISQKDEPTIAWLIKQRVSNDADFYTASPTPYFTACTILEKARALGNQSSRYYAAQFLHTWREQGTPFKAGTEDRQLLQASQLHQSVMSSASQQGNADSAFRFAWSMCRRYETALAAVHIGSRWAFALLGEAYAQKIQQIRQSDLAASNDRTRNRYGKGPVRTEAIAALVKLVYPVPTKKDHEVFRNRLRQASRWHTIVQGLGWGSLLLIPHEEVSNWWLERVLRVGQLGVFVNLVKRERPDLCAASKALEAWLGPDGIAGGPISEKQTLSIEAEAPATIYEVEEIQDSEDEDIEDVAKSPGSLHSQESVAPPERLRQMTLLELFHPAKGASLESYC